MEIVGAGRIKDGKLKLLSPDIWRLSLSRVKNCDVIVTIATAKKKRSTRANRLWWGPVIRAYQDIWSLARTVAGLPPYTKEQVHSVLVQVLVGSEPGPVPGTIIHMPTRNMDHTTFARMVDDAYALAWDSYQVRIPRPDDPPESAIS